MDLWILSVAKLFPSKQKTGHKREVVGNARQETLKGGIDQKDK